MKYSLSKGTVFFVITTLRLSLILVANHIHVLSAFVEVFPHRTPALTFCRFLDPATPQRNLQIASERQWSSSRRVVLLHSSTSLLLSSKYSSPQLSSINPIHSKPEHQRKEVELWLDLRGTKVAPNVALMYLIQDLHDTDPSSDGKYNYENTSRSSGDIDGDWNDNLVDKVLVSMDNSGASSMIYDKQRQQESQKMPKILPRENVNKKENANENSKEEVYALIYEDGTSGNLCCNQRGLEEDEDNTPINVGEVMTFSTSPYNLVDPIQALDVVSRGEWVLLDDKSSNMESNSQGNRSEMIQSLVELVSSGVSNSLPFFDVHGDIANDSNDDELAHATESNVILGGIAISCRNNAEILQIATCLKSRMTVGGEKRYTTTDSGIYFQESPDSKNDHFSSMISMSSDDTKNESLMKYAVVIPFDAELWKTATLLFT